FQQFVRSEQSGATGDFQRLAELDAVLICVPTPLDERREPDLSYVEQTARAISPNLRRGQLVVLSSTTYPGTTEELVLPILEQSGLRAGKDFFLAYSPERMDPGNRSFSMRETPRVVAGITPDCSRLASLLLSPVSGNIHQVA